VRFAFTEQQLELRAAFHDVLARECTEGDVRAVAELGAGAGRGAALAGAGRPRRPRAGGSRALGASGSRTRTRRALRGGGWSALPSPSPRPPGWWCQPRRRRRLPHVCTEARHLAASSLRLITGSGAASSVGGVGTHARRVVTDHDGGHRRRARDQPLVGAGRAALFLLACHGEEGPELHTVGAPASQVVATPSLDTTGTSGRSSGCPPRRPVWRAARPPPHFSRASVTGSAVHGAALAGVADRLITMTAATPSTGSSSADRSGASRR